MKKLFWKIFVAIDSRLKFPQLKKGEIGIQMGFDMDAPVTSDLFQLYKRVGETGKVIGIDPDPTNIETAQKLIDERNWNIELHQYAVSNVDKTSQLKLGNKRGWNQLEDIPIDSSADYKTDSLSVETRKFDTILTELNIAPEKIGHINLTVNGVEYHTLLGMRDFLKSQSDLAITVIAGRQDETGTIDGQPDHVLITEFLHEMGFKTKFKRVNQLFWWGFVNALLIHGKWVYGKTNYGVIMASKGKKRMPWYQSFC